MLRTSVFLVTELILLSALHGQGLRSTVEEFVQDDCIRSASVSLAVADLDGGSFVASYDEQRMLPPASTLKLLTAIQTLDLFDPDHKIQTILGYQGEILEDTLRGNIIIRGYGDPTLGSSHHPIQLGDIVTHWAQLIKELGIKYIDGDVIGDYSFLPVNEWTVKWPHEDLGNYYGATVTGLNVHDNSYTIHLRQTAILGGSVTIQRIEPEVPRLQLDSYVTSGPRGSGDQAYIIGAPLQYNRYIRGKIPVGNGLFEIKGSLPDPAEFLAYHLQNGLAAHAIRVGGTFRSSDQHTGSIIPLDTISSLSLRKIVQLTNQKSINLYAEALGLLASRQMPQRDRETYWKNAGVDLSTARLVDYSGLAPDNALSSAQMIAVLKYAYQDKALFERLIPSLAVAGESGTMRSLLRDSPARGAIFAKSGLINGVRNYAGYFKSNSDSWYAFSIFTYNPPCQSQVIRKKLEHLLESLYLSAP